MSKWVAVPQPSAELEQEQPGEETSVDPVAPGDAVR